jgi:hypothetical protein
MIVVARPLAPSRLPDPVMLAEFARHLAQP